jgi:succinoglycan biosynthesis protein ExoA
MSLINIIVGVKNEEKYIKRCINSLQNQTISDINIMVVDGLSADKTPEIVQEIMENDPRVKLLKNPHEIISTARNIGLEASDADYVAYLDGHCYVDEDWLETLLNTFKIYQKKCKLGGVGSTYSSPDDDSIFGKAIAYSVQTFLGGFGTSFTTEEKIVQVETVAFALYPRLILQKEQVTYDECMTQCEDTDFNYQLIKAGYHLLKHPRARVHQYRRSHPRQFFQQMLNYGEGRARFTSKYPETMHWYHLIPLITIIYPIIFVITLCLFSLGIAGLGLFTLISIPLIIYIVMDLLYSIMISLKMSNWKGLCSIIIFPLEHIGYGLGFLKGLLKRN